MKAQHNPKRFESRVFGVHFGKHVSKEAAERAIRRVWAKIKHECAGIYPASTVRDTHTGRETRVI